VVRQLIGSPGLEGGNLGTVHDCLNNLHEAADNPGSDNPGLDFDSLLGFGSLLDFGILGSDFGILGSDSPDSDSLLAAGNRHGYTLDPDFGTLQEFLLYYDNLGSQLAD